MSVKWTVPLGCSLLLVACEPSFDLEQGWAGIVGGTTASGDPAVVALVVDDGGIFMSCTGTLIASRTVVSAAHCVGPLPANAAEYAFFGSVVPQTLDARFIPITRRVPHPNWNENNTNTDVDDISIYQLATAVTNVTPIYLLETAPSLGQSVRHVGFGATTGVQTPNDGAGVKREVTTLLREVAGQIESGANGLGTCFGDSGGPAFVRVAGESAERIAGVVSWGDEDCLLESWDTRIDSHLAWIRQTASAWETLPTPQPDPPLSLDGGVTFPDASQPQPVFDGGIDGGVTADAGKVATEQPIDTDPPPELGPIDQTPTIGTSSEPDAGRISRAPNADQRLDQDLDGTVGGNGCSTTDDPSFCGSILALFVWVLIVKGPRAATR